MNTQTQHPCTRFYCTATIAQWNHAAGDYDEIDLEYFVVEYDAATAEEVAREAWIEHGYNPDRVTVSAEAIR